MKVSVIPEDQFCDAVVGSSRPFTPGSQRYSCVFCHGDVWLARSSQARVRRFPLTKVLCLSCLLQRPDWKAADAVVPTPESILRDVRDDTEDVQ